MPSCTAALELSCLLILERGDEVILPSWAYPSCASAVILRGGVPVFIDVDKDLNMDPLKIREAISSKTKAIMPIHYAGVVAEMPMINTIAESYGLYVIEDAAQAIGNWKVSGDFGCLSFHSTKNVQCGEGGALIVKNPAFIEKAEIIRDCGTTKARYKRGETSGYDWLEVGSSYLMSSYTAEHLHEELIRLPEITLKRLERWDFYNKTVDAKEKCTKRSNGHIFWFFVEDKWNWLKEAKGLKASSHYDALHLTIPGRKYGRAGGFITNSTRAMQKLVKLSTDGSGQTETARIARIHQAS